MRKPQPESKQRKSLLQAVQARFLRKSGLSEKDRRNFGVLTLPLSLSLSLSFSLSLSVSVFLYVTIWFSHLVSSSVSDF